MDVTVTPPGEMHTERESLVEKAAQDVCGRMRQFLLTWMKKTSSNLTQLGEQKVKVQAASPTSEESKVHVIAAPEFVARLIAIEALVRIFSRIVPAAFQLSPAELKEFYAALGETLCAGHVAEGADWRVHLCDTPLVYGGVQQVSALRALDALVTHILEDRLSLATCFRIDGLKVMFGFLTPGGQQDQIDRVLLDALIEDQANTTKTDKEIVIAFCGKALGLVYYISGVIDAKRTGIAPEEGRASFLQEANAKRRIEETMNSNEFSPEVLDLARRMGEKLMMSGSDKKETAGRGRRRRSQQPKEVASSSLLMEDE